MDGLKSLAFQPSGTRNFPGDRIIRNHRAKDGFYGSICLEKGNGEST